MQSSLQKITTAVSLLVLLAFSLHSCPAAAQETATPAISESQSFYESRQVQVVIHGDTNRNGRLEDSDCEGRDRWSWQAGAFVMANLDDDDRSGRPDASDQIVNGSIDEQDLARFRLLFDPALPAVAEITVDAGDAPVNVFQNNGGSWKFLAGQTPLALSSSGRIELGVEAKKFAGVEGWNGRIVLRATVRLDGRIVAEDRTEARVSPWLMLPNSAPTRAFYLATGKYDNSAMMAEVKNILPRWGVAFPTPHQAKNWQEMWMQDSLEIGFTEIPGGARMYVVLNGIRGADSFGPTLLGRDIGVITVGKNRNMTGHDAWVDWYGNLEVSHPTWEYPFGRIYYGCNTDSGVGLHPDVARFLEAQVLQDPFWVDTSWLAIKHVDEIFNVLPGADGRGAVIIADPAAAATLLGQPLDAFNREIQAKLDRMLNGGNYVIKGQTVKYPGIRALLGVPAERFVSLPVLYAAVQVDASSNLPGAHNKWSNPVNSVFLNGNVLLGGAHMPAAVKTDITRLR